MNVKFQGLKYNFQNVQECVYKNTMAWEFLDFTKLFY
jgi:hypothetical protein